MERCQLIWKALSYIKDDKKRKTFVWTRILKARQFTNNLFNALLEQQEFREQVDGVTNIAMEDSQGIVVSRPNDQEGKPRKRIRLDYN